MSAAPQTCSTPDRGYMGNRARGASLGRAPQRSDESRDYWAGEVALLERVLADYRSPAQAYLFKHLGDGAAEWQNETQRKLEEARAALHRFTIAAADPVQKFHLRRVRLNSGGYDAGGAYWGHGGELFEAYTDGGEFMTLRVETGSIERVAAIARLRAHWQETGNYPARREPVVNREAAKDLVREEYPNASFYK